MHVSDVPELQNSRITKSGLAGMFFLVIHLSTVV